MRKILVFSLVYYPRYVGGAEVAIKEITDRISPDEIQFDMITLGRGELPFEKIGNVNVHRLNLYGFFAAAKLAYPFFAFYKAIQLHTKNNYDSIWSMMASYAGFAGFLFKKKFPRVPFILSLQEGDNFERREGIFKYLFKKIFTHADHIQVISNFLRDWAVRMGATCPIIVVPNGVDLELFSQKKLHAELEILKKEVGKKTEDIFLITTSRLVVKNATSDVIEALQYLPDNVKFVVIGSGYQEKELQEKTKNLGLESRVNFLGFIPHKNMPQYLHISDIFIRPSLTEGFGNSYIEAMAAGIPVIATPVGGIVDFLIDSQTGLFCDVQSPKSIAQKVEKLIKDKESRDFIVKNALEMVKEKYQWSLIARDMKHEVFLRLN